MTDIISSAPLVEVNDYEDLDIMNFTVYTNADVPIEYLKFQWFLVRRSEYVLRYKY